MKERTFLGVSTLLISIISFTLFIQSCNSEDMVDSVDGYTAQEIAMIMELADKYELNIELDANYVGVKLSIEEMEAEFEALAALKGTYELVASEYEENTVVVKNEISHSRLKSSWETGSWSGSERPNTNYTVSMSVSWDFKTGNSASIKGDVDYWHSSSGSTSTTNVMWTLTGGIKTISYTCNLKYTSGRVTTTFSVHGSVNCESNSGSFSVY